MIEKNGHPFLYNFILILVVPTLVLLVVVSADLITHPLAVDRSGSAAVRLLTGGITAPLTVLVALFIMRRVPNNVIGPLLILWAANIAWTALRTDIEVPLLPVISDLSWYSLLIIALYFPTGRSYWKRYERWVDILCTSVLLLLTVNWVGQESLIKGQTVDNVLYVPVIARLQPLLTPFEVLIPFLLIGLALVSLFLRFGAAGTVERQQMKWLVWGFVMFLVTAIPFKIILWSTDSIDPTANEIYSRFVYIFPGVAIGIAILRHRLWDIDIIIRRTLIYSVLTAILALVYFGGVVLAQDVLRGIAGKSSDAAIVISTLLIAALFTPLRRRVQDGIDRRFYRRKYDAERTLAAFNATMRDEVDLDKLQAALVNVVQETMQPKSVGLWVRSDVPTSIKENPS